MATIYDDKEIKTRQSEKEVKELQNITGIDPADEKAMEDSAYYGAAEDIAEREDLGITDEDSINYTGGTKNKRKLNFSRGKKITASIAGFSIGTLIATSVIFTPILKMESILSRINERAFAIASSAIQHRLERLTKKYMIGRITGLDKCKSVASVDCRMNYSNMGVAKNLMATWQDNRIEEKLFDKMGFSLETDKKATGGYKYKITDRMGKSIDFNTIDDFEDFTRGHFKGGSREFGREINKVLKNNTKWYQVMQRKSIRKYLERKHDVKFWCFWGCTKKDEIDLKITSAKQRMKLKFVEKFVTPMSSKYGAIFTCLIEGDTVCPDINEKLDVDLNDEKLAGNDLDEVEGMVDESGKLVKEAGEEVVGEVAEDAAKKTESKLSQYAVEKIVDFVFKKKISGKAVAAAVPVAGQVYAALVTIDMVDRIDTSFQEGGLTKFAAALKIPQYISYYASVRTQNDEMKAGKIKLDEIGATADEFNGAQQSKVWQAYNKYKPTVSLLGSTAYAQDNEPSGDNSYLCDDNKPIPEGQLVCNEKKLDQTYAIQDLRNNQYADAIVNSSLGIYRGSALPPSGTPNPWYKEGDPIRGRGPRDAIRPILSGIDLVQSTVVGIAFDTALKVAEITNPGLKEAKAFFEEKASELLNWVFTKVFSLPVGIDSPGREKYDALEAGADIAASEFARGGETEDGEEYGLGAPAISDEDATAVIQDYYEQLRYDSQTGSLYTRLADVTNPYSFASTAVLSLPSNYSEFATNSVSNIASIPSGIFKNLSSLIFRPANAATLQDKQLSENAFGVSRAGFKLDDPIFDADPSIYTDEYCNELKDKRGEPTRNAVTGMEEYSVANPCLLEKMVSDAASSYFIDDENDPATMGPLPEDIVPIEDTDLTSRGNIRVHTSIVSQINALLEAAERDGIKFSGGGYRDSEGQINTRKKNCGNTHYDIYEKPSSQCSPPTARPGSSMHERGLAIDFTQNGSTLSRSSSGFDWLKKNAANYGLKNLPSEPWHWSTNGN